MNEFLFYLSGVVLFAILYFVYNGFFNKRTKSKYSKKLILYHGFKWGIFSWFGIISCAIVIIVLYVIYWLFSFNKWVEDKLS